MIITVDTGGYVSAMDLMYRANRHTGDAVLELSEVLDGCAGMSGTDSGGRVWADSYDDVATLLVRAGGDLGGSMGSVANLLNSSLINHEGADHSAQVYPGWASGSGDDDLDHASERFSLGEVPTGFGGVGGEPHGWHWLAERLEGLTWPDADTGSLRAAGSAWLSAGRVFEAYASNCAAAADEMQVQRSPETPIAAAALSELEGHCLELASAYGDVGSACRGYADQVEAHHHEVIDTVEELMAWTVVDQVSGAALSLITGGGSEVAAQLVESGIMATYAARVVGILRKLIELARVAAELIGRSLAIVTAMLARLKAFLSIKAVRVFERTGSTWVGRRELDKLPADIRQEVENAIERAHTGTIRFQGRDEKPFANWNPAMQLPPGEYKEWTAASVRAGKGRGDRILVEGDPANPRAIYYWNHGGKPVRIGP